MYQIGLIESLTWLVMVICGLIGFLFAGDSIKDSIPFIKDKNKEDNKFLRYLDVILGIVAGVWLSLLILDETAQFRWLTVFLFILFMIVSFAHPLKKLDGPILLLPVIPFFIVAIFAFLVKDSHPKNYTFFESTIPLWVILTVVALIMLIFFLMVYLVTETIVNPILYFVGWAPVILVVCILLIIQGILLLVFGVDGALYFLK